MRQYVSLPFNSPQLAYTLGISSKTDLIDQKRNIVNILPGFLTVIRVIPQLINTTDSFDQMSISTRNCKLSNEIEGLKLLKSYTKVGCEFECAVNQAVSVCKCMPWFYTNNFTDTPICNSFSGYCFEHFVSNESNYKKCPELCKEDCKGIPMTLVTNYVPINADELCKEGSFLKKQLTHSTWQHFAFENYKTLITGDGQIPDLQASMANGSLCLQFIDKFVGMVSVESPTSTVTKSAREPRVTFIDQLGTIGGTLGLFTGMSVLSMVEVVFFLVTFFKSCFKIKTKDWKDAVRVIIRGIAIKGGRMSDDEIGNTDSDQFGSNCSSDELKVKVEQLEEKNLQYEKTFKQHENIFKQHDKEINDLKQLLMLLLPADKKQMVQEHFDEKAKCALAAKSSKNDNFSISNDKKNLGNDLNGDEVSTYY